MHIELLARKEKTEMTWGKIIQIVVIQGNDEVRQDIDALIETLKKQGYTID